MRKTSHRSALPLFSILVSIAVLGAGCASSEYAHRRDADRRLSALVGERLAHDPALSTAKVAAWSHWGVVVLVGEVVDENSKREAGRIASAVAGVVRVNNLILVVEGDARAEGSTPAKAALILARTD
jgi:hypothetical protein